ncbi:MAG: PKD domain-containing protein, partial [Bacteroidetes bacterium]|nr:PKD domain-containing protein [Bacteroidota bacterium]
ALIVYASGASGTVNWYDTIAGGTSIFTGDIFVTPLLTTTTSYYAEDEVLPDPLNVGPIDGSIGAGANIIYNQFLLFDVMRVCTLVSVWVDADVLGNRTIELKDNTGTVLDSRTILIPAGPSRITLNFELTPGLNYRLGVVGTGHGLFRNNSGVSYPYELPGWVKITRGSNFWFPYLFYFFFYDWEIQGADCHSPRAEAVAHVEPLPTASFSYSQNFNTIDFTNTSSSNSNVVDWSFGDGNTSTDQNPTHTYVLPGNYDVQLNTTNDCGSADVVVNIKIEDPLGIGDESNTNFNIHPNPASGTVNISNTGSVNELWVTITNVLGQLVLSHEYDLTKGIVTLDISHLVPGFYSVDLFSGKTHQQSKLIVE